MVMMMVMMMMMMLLIVIAMEPRPADNAPPLQSIGFGLVQL